MPTSKEARARWITKKDAELWPQISVMLDAGLTQEKISKAVGIPQPSVSMIATIHRRPRQKLPAEIVNCAHCGKPRKLVGSQRWKNIKHFCSKRCYWDHLHDPSYNRSVYGCKLARRVISEYFTLSAGNVVHHHNKNGWDNRIENLAVFLNQGDHMNYHRGGPAEPIFDGAKLRKSRKIRNHGTPKGNDQGDDGVESEAGVQAAGRAAQAD